MAAVKGAAHAVSPAPGTPIESGQSDPRKCYPKRMPPPPGPFKPGSFTKNFAWHGKGLLKLHEGIRRGFSGRLEPVSRTDFRAACGLDDAEFLLAANFFLFNIPSGGVNVIPVDEFVRQALQEPHSLSFDRLGLFVLNLSRGGRRVGSASGMEYPSQWANEFVRQSLWQDGRWRRDALNEADMDAFLAPRIAGVPAAKQKMRTNYRHIFELARYLPSPSNSINTDPEGWAAGALFVAWDRRALALGTPTPASSVARLVTASISDEDHKLLGISTEEFRALAEPIAEQYLTANGIRRLAGAAATSTASPRLLPTSPPPAAVPTSAGLIVTPPASRGPPIDFGVLANSTATDTAVARQIQQRLAQKRDQRLAWLIKDLYEHRCMACGSRLAVGLDPERFYAEAAHIKPLGKPHNGPDVASNLLVLCPNHHLQFDRGVLSVQLHRASFRFVSHLTDDVAHHRPVSLRGTHTLDPRCVQWHSDFFSTVFAK